MEANKKPAAGTNALLAGMRKPGDRREVKKKKVDDFIPDPKQPRSAFRPVNGKVAENVLIALRELADDIHENGLIQPILYRVEGGQAIISVGERRWRAVCLNRELGRPDSDEIDCILRNDLTAGQLRLVQLSENLQRDDLTDLETAQYIRDILEEHPDLKKKDIGQIYKKGGSQYVSRILALLDPQWADVVETGIIPYASLLEQYRPLPDTAKEELKQLAAREKRSLTSGDIRAAKARAEGKVQTAPALQAVPSQIPSESGAPATGDAAHGSAAPRMPASNQLDGSGTNAPALDEGLANQVQEFLQASAPQGETYKPSAGAAAGTAPRENKPRVQDTGGEAVIPAGTAALSPALFERREVRLTLQQLAAMLNRKALTNMAHSVSVMLPVEEIREALRSMGGALPEDDNMVVPTLLDTVNHL